MTRFFPDVFPLLAMIGFSLAATVSAEPKTGTIVVLGDSLSEGFRIRGSEAYPALIERRVKEANLPFTIVNAGVSGDTTTGGLRRLEKLLDRPIDVLLVELGINDAFRRVPVSTVKENLQAIIDRTRARNPEVKIVVVGLDGLDKLDPQWGPVFSGIYPELARKNRAALVPDLLRGVAGVPELNLPDRLHPNARGHQVLAENVWKVLEPVLRGKAGA